MVMRTTENRVRGTKQFLLDFCMPQHAWIMSFPHSRTYPVLSKCAKQFSLIHSCCYVEFVAVKTLDK